MKFILVVDIQGPDRIGGSAAYRKTVKWKHLPRLGETIHVGVAEEDCLNVVQVWHDLPSGKIKVALERYQTNDAEDYASTVALFRAAGFVPDIDKE